MDLAHQRIQRRRKRRDQRLSLTGDHLGNHALMQHIASHHLHVVVPHLQLPLADLAHGRKDFRQQFIQRLAVGQLLPPAVRRFLQLGVRLLFHFRFERIDAIQHAAGYHARRAVLFAHEPDLPDTPLVRRTEQVRDLALAPRQKGVEPVAQGFQEFHLELAPCRSPYGIRRREQPGADVFPMRFAPPMLPRAAGTTAAAALHRSARLATVGGPTTPAGEVAAGSFPAGKRARPCERR